MWGQLPQGDGLVSRKPWSKIPYASEPTSQGAAKGVWLGRSSYHVLTIPSWAAVLLVEAMILVLVGVV